MSSEDEVIGLLLGDWFTWTTSIVSLQLQTHADGAKHFTHSTFSKFFVMLDMSQHNFAYLKFWGSNCQKCPSQWLVILYRHIS